MNLVTGAIEKSSVDKDEPLLRFANAFFQVHRGASLFVHDADFEGVARQFQHVFDFRE